MIRDVIWDHLSCILNTVLICIIGKGPCYQELLIILCDIPIANSTIDEPILPHWGYNRRRVFHWVMHDSRFHIWGWMWNLESKLPTRMNFSENVLYVVFYQFLSKTQLFSDNILVNSYHCFKLRTMALFIYLEIVIFPWNLKTCKNSQTSRLPNVSDVSSEKNLSRALSQPGYEIL